MNVESECEEIRRVTGCRKDVFGYLKVSFADLEEDIRFEKLSNKSRYYNCVSLARFSSESLRAYSCRIAHPNIVLQILHHSAAEHGILLNVSKRLKKYDETANLANVCKSPEK